MSRDLRVAEQLRQHDNRMKAWSLRLSGYSYAQIAEVLGCHTSWAYQLVKRALADIEAEPIEQVRQMEMERLDAGVRAVVAILATHADVSKKTYDPDMALKAVDRLVKLSESRRKLTGADIPATTLDPVDPAEEAEKQMREWLAQQKAARTEDLKAEAAF